MDLILANYSEATEFCSTRLGKEYFSFCLSYVPGDCTFREIDRFRWESRHMHTRFKNQYSGPVVIDLTQWAGHHPNDHFDAFFYYLKDHYKEQECILLSEKFCDSHILERLEEFYPIMITDHLCNHTSRKLNRIIGFATEEEGRRNV